MNPYHNNKLVTNFQERTWFGFQPKDKEWIQDMSRFV